jgi:hypothetical protein
MVVRINAHQAKPREFEIEDRSRRKRQSAGKHQPMERAQAIVGRH